MNPKERYYSGVARETIHRITANRENWTSFLATMARNYDFTYGLTQEQLAEQLGVAANTIARIETGNRGISIDLAIELVVRFETTLDYIFLGRE